jgi:oligopeptide transport system ATP-binding protein
MDICAEIEPPAFVSPNGSVSRCHLHTSGPTLAGAPISVLVNAGTAS